jgi:hypothetical protein
MPAWFKLLDRAVSGRKRKSRIFPDAARCLEFHQAGDIAAKAGQIAQGRLTVNDLQVRMDQALQQKDAAIEPTQPTATQRPCLQADTSVHIPRGTARQIGPRSRQNVQAELVGCERSVTVSNGRSGMLRCVGRYRSEIGTLSEPHMELWQPGFLGGGRRLDV